MSADYKACRGKGSQPGVMSHIANRAENLALLHEMLKSKQFVTSPYKRFTIHEPKAREIFRLPYFPDRIVHHAIMNVMEPIWVSVFTADTYSCIKGRGIHSALKKIEQALKNEVETQYCLKLDVRKFYPSVNHDILKMIIRKKVKDRDVLELMDAIIDSADGLPIGNYLSQYMANLYLSYFDHWLKEEKRVRHYFRYCDDMVILAGDKSYLHQLRVAITKYLWDNLKLTVKGNYQVFPVSERGIDFVGYKFYHTHTSMRKSIKKSFARAVAARKSRETLAAYAGWAKHANSKHLLKTLRRKWLSDSVNLVSRLNSKVLTEIK